MKFPYTLKSGSLKKYFEKIPSVGLEKKITLKYIESLGFKSSNDRSILPILKFLKFIDDSGAPTKKYEEYRDKSKSSKILGAAVKESYSALFRQYPDAENKEHSTLQNYFSTNSGLGKSAVKAMVETFKALCSIADLEGGEELTQEFKEDTSTAEIEDTTYHNILLGLSTGKKAKLVIPRDIQQEDIEKLKKLLDVFG